LALQSINAGAWGSGTQCAVTMAQPLGLRWINQQYATMPQLVRRVEISSLAPAPGTPRHSTTQSRVRASVNSRQQTTAFGLC